MREGIFSGDVATKTEDEMHGLVIKATCFNKGGVGEQWAFKESRFEALDRILDDGSVCLTVCDGDDVARAPGIEAHKLIWSGCAGVDDITCAAAPARDFVSRQRLHIGGRERECLVCK